MCLCFEVVTDSLPCITHIFQMHFFLCFAHLFVLDVHLFEVQIYCCEYNFIVVKLNTITKKRTILCLVFP
jgi:hypothetical protein